MALSFDLQTKKSIDFDDFVSFVNAKVDNKNPMSLLECVDAIQMLSNNSEFLVDFVNKELSDIVHFQSDNSHTVQSLLLHKGRDFYIRINAWPPISENPHVNVWQNDLYYYLKAHDHNFWFLTSGYLGSGYETEIWEYDYDSVVGYAGEPVDISFLEKTSLPKGKAMLYRASKDIHTQISPKEFAISINIMLTSIDLLEREQYYFDTERKIILGNTNTILSARHLILDLAGQLGDVKTINMLENIATKHPFPHLRLKSYEVLKNLTGDSDYYWKKALLDKSSIVSRMAKINLKMV